MLNTHENIEKSKKEWEEIFKELGVTDETSMSHEYDYVDEDD